MSAISLLLALLEYQTGDADTTDYCNDYTAWIANDPPGSKGMLSKKQEITLAKLYDVLHHNLGMDTVESSALGTVLARVMPNNLAGLPQDPDNLLNLNNLPGLQNGVQTLRNTLRAHMIDQLHKLKENYP